MVVVTRWSIGGTIAYHKQKRRRVLHHLLRAISANLDEVKRLVEIQHKQAMREPNPWDPWDW